MLVLRDLITRNLINIKFFYYKDLQIGNAYNGHSQFADYDKKKTLVAVYMFNMKRSEPLYIKKS